jgi:hypothetical protein
MSGYGIKRGEGSTEPIIINKGTAISRGRFISKLEYRKSDKGQWFLIEVKDGDGRTARRSYFPPVLGSQFIPDAAALKKEQDKFNSTMRNLTNVFLTPKYETGEVNTFEEFCNKVISDIGKSYYDKELRVKLVLNKKNEPTLPNWPVMFEDPILISDEMSKMKLTEWDRVVPIVITMDAEKSTSNVPSKSIAIEDIPIPSKAKVSEDDLPF